MAPTLFGKKTENCRTSGPSILEVVSGKSTCMFFEFRDKNSGREYLTVRLPFPTEFVPVNVCLVGSQAAGEMLAIAIRRCGRDTQNEWRDALRRVRDVRKHVPPVKIPSCETTPFSSLHDSDRVRDPRSYQSFDLFIALILFRIAPGHGTNRK